MPELTKDWGWRKTPDCYHMPAFGSEDNLLASIGIGRDEENICIDRVTNLQEYRVTNCKQKFSQNPPKFN